MADNTQPARLWWEVIPWHPLLWLMIQTIGMVALIVQMRSDINSLKAENAEHSHSIESINDKGSAGLRLLEARVVKNEERMTMIAADHLALQKSITENSLTATRDALKAQSAADLLANNLKRIEDQQARMIQALDNTYSLINEHLRDSPASKNPRLNLKQQPNER